MPLPLQTFDQLVNNQVAAIQASSLKLTDFTVGSFVLALCESNAGNSIWIQALISKLLAVTRLQTSTGLDVDSFVEQFGYARPAGRVSSGTVTFGRTITTSLSYIPASTTTVQTSINQILFKTTVDATNPNYDAATNSYIMGLGISSINVPVTCNIVGTIGNVSASAIDTIVQSITNVNTVTNTLPFVNGADIATDEQTKRGFVLYLAGLSKATYAAIASATISVPNVFRYLIVENESEAGTVQLGFFYVVIDNGLGTTTEDTRNEVAAAIELVRGLAIQYDVVVASANAIPTITANIICDTGSSTVQDEVELLAKNALIDYISTLPIGGTLYYTRCIQVIYDASDHIIDVTDLLLDGGTSDYTATTLEVITLPIGNITFSMFP